MKVLSYTAACCALIAGLVLGGLRLTGPQVSFSDLVWGKCDNCSEFQTSNGFELVAPRIFRYNYAWPMLWMKTPLATFILDGGRGHWILVDSGVPDRKYIESLLTNVRAFITEKGGELNLVISKFPCCILDAHLTAGTRSAYISRSVDGVHGLIDWSFAVTHHHMDHIGGLKEVLTAFPAARLVAHVAEKPFLIEGISTGTLPSKNRFFNALAALGFFNNKKAEWPASRVSSPGRCKDVLNTRQFPNFTYVSFKLYICEVVQRFFIRGISDMGRGSGMLSQGSSKYVK
jgi:Metallo-beta-lactamase superfamily